MVIKPNISFTIRDVTIELSHDTIFIDTKRDDMIIYDTGVGKYYALKGYHNPGVDVNLNGIDEAVHC